MNAGAWPPVVSNIPLLSNIKSKLSLSTHIAIMTPFLCINGLIKSLSNCLIVYKTLEFSGNSHEHECSFVVLFSAVFMDS